MPLRHCVVPEPTDVRPSTPESTSSKSDTNEDLKAESPSNISLSDAASAFTECCSDTVHHVDHGSKVEIVSLNRTSANSLPLARLWLAHIGAALTLFLATTDATIVSTSLPTIVADLKGTQAQYSWVGVAYLLTQTAFQPLYGRFSDLLGRKIVLYTSVAIFMTGSLLCGLAPTLVWLCIFRALSGIGAGGIVSSVWLITSEIVEEKNRAKWSQALSVTWSASALAGPLLGGAFSGGHLTWRWAFFITLPIGSFAFIILFWSLRHVALRPATGITWRTLWLKFDFLGLFCFMGGTVGVILGFSFSSDNGWTAPSTLAPLVIGVVVLIFGSVHETRTKRDALFPPSMFHDITTGVILVISFLHNFAFNAGTFYLALYYQAVNGSSPLEAGLRMLPYSLGSSLASMPAAWFIGYWQRKTNTTSGQKWVISFGLAIATLGFGLLILLDEYSSFAVQVFSPLIAGIGIGMLFHAPYQVLTKALRPEQMSSATSAFFLVRFTGSTTGLAVAGAIFNGRLLHSGLAGASLVNSDALTNLQGIAQVHAVATAIKFIWIVCTPCLGLSLLLSPLIRSRPKQGQLQELDTTEKSLPPMELVPDLV